MSANKITWEDKIALNPRKVRVNQWQDQDILELKTKFNANDDRIDAFSSGVMGSLAFTDVSAIWTSGLSFDVTADSYLVNNTQYSSTSGTVTLDTADATLDRIDLIVAVAPVSPATVGTVGKISGTPASPTVVVPPDYASDSVYVIKQVLVKAAQTEPFGTSKTVVFDEGSEWTVTYPTGFSLVSSGAYNGTNCIFGDNVSVDEKITFTSGSPYTYNDVDLITFYIKSTNPSYWNGTNNLSIRFLNSGTLFKSVSYNDQNGIYNEWNKVSISKDLLGLKDGTFNQIQIVPSVGLTYSFLLDIIEIHQGSGSEPNNLISQWYNDVGYITEGKRIVDATVTTTYDLDHALASDWKLTMTGNTTFTESNLPTGDNTTEFTIKLTGAFTPTFPAYWDVLGDAYDGAVWNFIAVQIHDGNSGTEEVTAFITNM